MISPIVLPCSAPRLVEAETRAECRELVQRAQNARAERLLADEAQHRHHDQQQRENSGEPVPGQADYQQVGVVIAEFLQYRVRNARPPVPTLPSVQRPHNLPQQPHDRPF